MGLLGYKIYDKNHNEIITLIGTQTRKLLEKYRFEGNKVVVVRKKKGYTKLG